MAAVLAAILAAFLAGAIALFRERRLEARRLRIAARVMEATVVLAIAGVKTASGTDGWNVLDKAPGHDAFEKTWKDHRDILAGHLSKQEWDSVQRGVRDYLLEFYVEREGASNDSPRKERLERLAAKLEKSLAALTPLCG